jgi:hypothetical protein
MTDRQSPVPTRSAPRPIIALLPLPASPGPLLLRAECPECVHRKISRVNKTVAKYMSKMEKHGSAAPRRRMHHVPLQVVGSSSSSSTSPSPPISRRLLPKAEVESKYADKMEEILQNTFGHLQFRPSQREVMVSILSGSPFNIDLNTFAHPFELQDKTRLCSCPPAPGTRSFIYSSSIGAATNRQAPQEVVVFSAPRAGAGGCHRRRFSPHRYATTRFGVCPLPPHHMYLLAFNVSSASAAWCLSADGNVSLTQIFDK